MLAIAGAASASAAWQPEPATYGVGQATYTISGSGGTPLNVRLYYPTTKSGAEASGTFPVLLAQTPYGGLADTGASALGAGGAALTGYNPYLVERGYIMVSMDVRGTGSSGGTFGLFDPVQGQDGAIAIRWAAKLPHSSGVVGLLGASYLGIDQFAAAADAGADSPVKAIFPIISSTELYRDEVTAGGIPSLEFNLPYLAALVPGVSLLNAVTGPPADLLQALSGQLQTLIARSVPLMTNIISGGAEAFDGPYWQSRSPDNYIRQIVADKIPAFLVGGWYDLFQRGEPLNYSGFQNAYRSRSILAPMLKNQRTTGRYQLVMAPTYHVTTGDLEYRGMDIAELELAWFDHWLKGINTGINDTPTPLHVYDLGTDSYREATTYPFRQAKPTTYYFHGGGELSPAAPTSASGSDQIVFTGTSIPCSTSLEQWGAGIGELLFNDLGSTDPCTKDATLSEQGPGAVSYTTASFKTATTLAGPIGATIYAKANTKDTEWVVSIADVGPNGAAHQLTQGVLDGSLRALDQANTWPGSNGRPILPYHPYTQSSQEAVVPGQVTRYDVEVFPTFDTLLPGHRLRVTINTDDFPHVFPSVPQFANMIGGVWQVERTASAASGVELPLSTPSAFGTPAEPLYCGRASGWMAGRTLGPVKLGQTSKKVRTEFLHEAIRGRWHNWEFLCLQGQYIEAWYPSPTFLRRLHASERRALRGRVALLLTANRHYTLDGAHAGSRIAAVARRLHLKGPFKIGRISWYYVPEGRSDGVLKVRGGRVEDVGIALRQLISFGSRFWPYVTKRG